MGLYRNCNFEVDEAQLSLKLYDSKRSYAPYLILPLIPVLKANGEQIELKAVRAERSEDAFTAYCCGAGWNMRTRLEFHRDCVTFSCSLDGQGSLDSIVYGGGPLIAADEGRVNCELFTWSPDLNRSLVPKAGRISLALSSLELRDERSFARGDGGRFIIPPYVCAVRLTEDLVLGAGTLGVPDSIQGLQPIIEDRKLSFLFDYQGALSVQGTYEAPSIVLFTAEDYDSVMNFYRDRLFSAGMAEVPRQWEPHWSLPIYCTIGDQAYASMTESGSLREADFDAYANQFFLDEMIALAERKHLSFGNVILDAGWMKNAGYWDVDTERFPDLRGYMERLRSRGIRCILWYTPYDTQFNGRCEYFYRDRPDFRVRDGEGNPLDLLDYTNPEVREFVASRLRYMLSDEEGCLGADGLKVDFYYHIYSEKGLRFFDPSYGTGERLQYKALKFIYDTAKAIKPSAYIEGSSANPLFNDTQDACRLNDDVTGNPRTYERRAWITSVSGCNLPDTDDWWSYRENFVHLTMEKCVFGIPAVYAIKYRGEQGHMLFGYNQVAPGGNPVAIEERDYRALSAILAVYRNCPVDASQRREIDLRQNFFARYHTSGRLRNFYAAVCLNENTALATYSADCAALCSLKDTRIVLPLPEGCEPVSVTRVTPEGEFPQAFEHSVQGLSFDVRACGREGSYYRIGFKSSPNGEGQ